MHSGMKKQHKRSVVHKQTSIQHCDRLFTNLPDERSFGSLTAFTSRSPFGSNSVDPFVDSIDNFHLLDRLAPDLSFPHHRSVHIESISTSRCPVCTISTPSHPHLQQNFAMAPRIVTPPPSELTSFEAFSAAMMTAPLGEICKIYNDSDDEYGPEESDGYAVDDSDEDMDDDDYDPTIIHASSLMADPFSNSEDESENEVHDDNSLNVYFDPRYAIDRTTLTPDHAKSRHIDPELQSMVDRTEIFLEQMSLQFKPAIEEQPMSTTIVLANQAIEQVLKPYRVHGSQARLSESALRFLSAGSRVRRPGKDRLDGSKDGELRFVDHPVRQVDQKRVSKLKRKADERFTNDNGYDDDDGGDGGSGKASKIKIQKRSNGTLTIVSPLPRTTAPSTAPPSARPKSNDNGKEWPSSSLNVFGERVGYGFQPASTIPLDGPKAEVDSLSNRKTSGPLDLCELQGSASQESFTAVSKGLEQGAPSNMSFEASNTRQRHGVPLTINTSEPTKAKTLFTPLAKSFSTFAIKTPTSSPSNLSQATTVLDQTDSHSCIVDPVSNAELALEAYNPISMKLTWPASTTIRGQEQPCMPTRTILDAFNTIIHLYNAEGRNLLSYYVRKYGDPVDSVQGAPSLNHNDSFSSSFSSASTLTAGSGYVNKNNNRNGPPHALFRLGISQYLHSRIGNIIDTKEVDELGLTPETRRILGEVWEQYPSINARFADDTDDESDDEKENLGRTYARTGFRRSSSPSPHPSAAGTTTTTLPDYDSDMDIDTQSTTSSTPTVSSSHTNTAEDIGPTYAARRNLHKHHLGLNPIERQLLARACNVSVETVEAYWDVMREKTRAWGGMMLWCRVKSKERIERAKREGRW